MIFLRNIKLLLSVCDMQFWYLYHKSKFGVIISLCMASISCQHLYILWKKSKRYNTSLEVIPPRTVLDTPMEYAKVDFMQFRKKNLKNVGTV